MGIRYSGFVPAPQTRTTRVFQTFSALPEAGEGLTPRVSFGIAAEGGLASGVGLKLLTVYAPPEPPVRGYRFRDAFFFYGESGGLYRLGATGFERLGTFSAPPQATEITLADHRQGILFFLGGEWYLFDGTFVRKNGVSARLAEAHYERLFVWDGEKLRFSAALDPFGWTQGVQDAGYAYLPSENGEVVAAISRGERLVLMRECGATVFRAFGDNRNFKAVEVKFPCGGVIGPTAVSAGDAILFCAGEGVYRFDGETVSLVCKVRFQPKEACFSGELYCANGTRQGQEVLFVLPVRTGKGYFLRLRARALAGNAFCAENRFFELADEGTQPVDRVWDSGLTDFGAGSGRKLFEQLFLDGEGEALVRIYGVLGKRDYTVRLPHRFRPLLRGRRFGFSFRPQGRTRLSRAEVTLRED